LTVAIRELCRKIIKEKDPERTQRLLSELRQTLSIESDETRLRVRYAARLLKNKEKTITKSDPTG
jgi:flagellar biosynthesis/type III secretory pathway protein FliH